MALPVIPSWALNDPITSAKLQAMSNVLAFLMGGALTGRPICKVGCGVTQSIPNNAATALTFDTNLLDPRSMHSAVTNPTRIRPTEAGEYLVGAACAFFANATGDRELWFRVNGTDPDPGMNIAASTAITRTLCISTPLYFNGTTDYVEAMVLQTSGGALGTALNNAAPRFWAIHTSLV